MPTALAKLVRAPSATTDALESARAAELEMAGSDAHTSHAELKEYSDAVFVFEPGSDLASAGSTEYFGDIWQRGATSSSNWRGPTSAARAPTRSSDSCGPCSIR